MGYKKDRPAQQIVNVCLNVFKFFWEEEVDFTPCSPSLLFKLIDHLQEECKLGHGGSSRLGYILDAIS